MKTLLRWLNNKFGVKQEVISYQIDITPWHDGTAQALYEYLKTDAGNLFIKHLRKYQIDVNQWATDVSMENYESMKYRASVAHGVKLTIDKVLEMSKFVPQTMNEEVSKSKLDNFFKSRMGLFKS